MLGVLVFIFRFTNCLQMNIAYLGNLVYFPPLVRGKVGQITGSVARLGTSLTPFIIEHKEGLLAINAGYLLALVVVFSFHLEPYKDNLEAKELLEETS